MENLSLESNGFPIAITQGNSNSSSLPDDRCAFCHAESCIAQKQLWGCASKCGITCDTTTCDYTCPSRPAQFVDRWREVDSGWPPKTTKALFPCDASNWPRYLPMLQHASGFHGIVDSPLVVVPTFKRLGPVRGRRLDRNSIRKSFNLLPSTQILCVSVDHDQPLEFYWSYRRKRSLAPLIAGWDIEGITIPNFSYFPDAPPSHTFWNFCRMLQVAEELSDVGVPIIPHVNMLEEVHRLAWGRLLREQTQITVVCKEFQTGAKKKEIGKASFYELCRLRDEVNRDLHPIVVGGGRFWNLLKQHFKSFTVVDSRPFMTTVYRHEIIGYGDKSLKTSKHELPVGAPLDELWKINLDRYVSILSQR